MINPKKKNQLKKNEIEIDFGVKEIRTKETHKRRKMLMFQRDSKEKKRKEGVRIDI